MPHRPTYSECTISGSLASLPQLAHNVIFLTSPSRHPHPAASASHRSVDDCKAKLQQFVAEINADLANVSGPGPCSKFVLPEENISGR